MRVYHFLPLEFGLDDIRRKRLKLARANELNDPFELISPSLADKRLRRALIALRDRAHDLWGFLCFSKGWRNPVQWSHYADRHRGICLGFDVADEYLAEVHYSGTRLDMRPADFDHSDPRAEALMMKAISTKYEHWQYEEEMRLLAELKGESIVRESDLFFLPWGDELTLKEVLIGDRCKVGKDAIISALGDMRRSVKVKRVRCAFQKYEMCEDQRTR